MAKRLFKAFILLTVSTIIMTTAVSASSTQPTLCVSSDYNSSTEGWGTTKFGNYSSALTYASTNAKKATIEIVKTTTVSGNCIDQNTHKSLSNLSVVINDGAVMGNANSKWDMPYKFTVKPGGKLQSARSTSSSIGNSHIKNTLTVGEANADKKAVIDFHKGTYQDMSIAVLYNGKLIANNALIKVADLGLTGSSEIVDSEIYAKGIVAFGKNNLYKHTLTNSTVYVGGNDMMNEKTYYSTTGTLIHNLTMNNSTIEIGTEENSSIEPVTIKKLTMKDGSVVKTHGTNTIAVSGDLIIEDSSVIITDTLQIDSSGVVTVGHDSSVFSSRTVFSSRAALDGINKVTGTGKIIIDAADGGFGTTNVYIGDDFRGTVGVINGDGMAASISDTGYVEFVEAKVINNKTGATYADLQSALNDAKKNETVMLLDDAVLEESIVLDKQINVTIDGNGYKIVPAESYSDTQNGVFMLGNSGYRDSDASSRIYTLNNVVFDGFEGWSVIRAQGVTLNMNNCAVTNCTQTGGQALLRLDYTEATIENTVVTKNTALMAITHNYNADDSATALTVNNCTVENNVFNDTAALYYVTGSECTLSDSKFIGNEVNCNGNGATVYLGFNENCAVEGCLFKDNDVVSSTGSMRVTGGLFFGYSADVTGNAFEGNTAANSNGSIGLGKSVATSVYYDCTIDLDGNYFDGREPIEGHDFFVQHRGEGAGKIRLSEYNTGYYYDSEGVLVVFFDSQIKLNNWFAFILKKMGASIEITVEASEGGAVGFDGAPVARYGKDITFTVSPEEGYEIADVLVDGVSVGAVSEYTIDKVIRAHTVKAEFRKLVP